MCWPAVARTATLRSCPFGVYQLDPAGDAATLLDVFSFAGFPSPPGVNDLIHALAANPESGAIYAAMTTGDLAVLDLSDPANITVTYVGTMTSVLDGLTFIPVPAPAQ